jgi:sterol 14-demethylase
METQKTPPMASGGLPVVGHAFSMMKDQMGLLKRGLDENGAPFSIKLGKRNCAVLLGPEHAKIFFTQTDKNLRIDKAYEFLLALFGKMGFLQEPEEYQNQRPIQLAPFKKKKMLSYIPIMEEEVQAWLDGLGDEGEFCLNEEMKYLTQVIAAHTLMGREFRQQLGREFWELYTDISNALDPYLPPHWPFPKFIRRDRAKQKMTETLQPMIEARRQNPEKYDDFLQEMLTTRTKDGRELTIEEAINWVIGLMFAGHETTFGHGSWLLIQMLQNPWYLELAQQEIHEKLPYGTPFSIEHIVGLEHLQWAIDETERMRPVAPTLFRYVQDALEVDDYVIPAGWWVMLDTLHAHHLEEHFHDPEHYNPLRFSPAHNEGKGRFKLTGFGGGVHTCTGKNFAHYEMKVIVSLLLQQFELTLLTPDPQPVQGKGAIGPSDTILRYKRKKLVKRSPVESGAAAGCPHMQAAMAQQAS